MKTISANKITKIVAELCIRANLVLRKDVLSLLHNAYLKEKNSRAKKILQAIIENAKIARKEKLAICQDTGLPCVLVEIGNAIKINGDLRAAINKGIESGYKKGYLRNSVIINPLLRGKPKYSPGVIHFDFVKGNKLKLTVLPKGFGCENKAQLRMFRPTAEINEIKKFILEAVKSAGPDACPPYVVGVGIGGTADYACFLAKKALLREIGRKGQSPSGTVPSELKGDLGIVLGLERELLYEINKLNIGPMGLSGKATALAVNVETFPTHIAGLPVAVNICCHALRSATATL
ncbi:MAG: fumarate hydratase [Candidatus Omnitrophica bacterium]|nr:fumarate hydratase [Candidatus Omnitrophota bacterium]